MMRASFALLLALCMCGAASAADLAVRPGFAALTSDRVAHQIGDSLTVLVFETSSATRSSGTTTKREARIAADAFDGTGGPARAQASYGGGFNAGGENVRSGNLIAQLSVTVEAIAPNGDLMVSGGQSLKIDGEKTRIKLHGQARPADISANNTIVSTRLSNVFIEYDGRGFATRSARPGLVASILNWLGVL